MAPEFPIIEVPAHAAQSLEAIGTKPKFWFNEATLGRCLFKQSRSGTGEDWAEKIASEIADTLDIPHATYELASWGGIRGTVSASFISPSGGLIHGNEVLLQVVPGYATAQRGSKAFYRVSQHTLDVVLGVIELSGAGIPQIEPSLSRWITTPSDVFVGYLLLDALIGNTDRHHANWGWAGFHGEEAGVPAWILQLAPTFDHASSLGRELSDKERVDRLRTRDRGYSIAAYVEKTKSALYHKPGDQKPLTTLDAFRLGAQQRPEVARAWLEKLDRVPLGFGRVMLDRIPAHLASVAGREFATAVLDANRSRLLEIRREIS